MDVSRFTKPHGRIIRTPQGYDAFVPDPLPHSFELSPGLQNLQSIADRRLGELMGTARMLPNQQLLIAPLTHLESVLSSRIEGTQATVADLAIFEASGEAAFGPASDVKEVRNYRRALNHGLQRLSSLPLSLRFVRELHSELLRDVLSEDKTPGEFRTSQVWIGPPGCLLTDATYVPPPPSELMPCLADWESLLHEGIDIPTLVKSALLHYQFEAIHPFVDGNGRVGRLLLIVFLLAGSYVSTPILFVSPFFARHRDQYYDLLRGVTESSAWHPWIEFFLRAVAIQSRDAVIRAQRLLDLQQNYRDHLSRASRSSNRLMDLLFITPAVTVSAVAHQLDVTWPTANAAVSLLCEVGILDEVTGQRRDRLFLARGIVDVINEELGEEEID